MERAATHGSKKHIAENKTVAVQQNMRGMLAKSLSYSMVLALCFFSPLIVAQQYPAKPVRIVASATGTSSDYLARYVGQKLTERWGKPVVVENRTGGPAATAAPTAVARATPDGYTLLMAETASLAIAVSLYKLAYHPIKDLAPVTLVASAPLVVVGHASLPVSTLQELIAYARQHPHLINYSSGGPGTVAHLTSALLAVLTQVDVVHVPYKGAGAALMAVLGGEAHISSLSATVAVPHIKSGKVKAYAVTGKKRSPILPAVPTGIEAGLPDFEAEVWFGLLAPAGTPSALVTRLNRDVTDILNMPATRSAFLAQGTEPVPMTASEFALFIQSEIPKWARVIKASEVAVE
jgi:tripartite-type tricarboxylate transporter receptor subunit TctC